MRLFFHPISPNARRVLATINHLDMGDQVDLVEVNLMKGEQKKPEFLRLNPNAKIPTLQDGEFALWESHAIMQYLADKTGAEDLYPEDRQTRCTINSWMQWNLAHLGRHIDNIAFERVFRRLFKRGEPNQKLLEEAEGFFARFAGVLNNVLEGRQSIVTDHYTLADFSIAASFTYRGPAQVDLDRFGHLKAWLTGVEELDAFKKLPPAM